MNILLDAYFDANYGDDLFVKVITGMFPRCKFYAVLEYYPEMIIHRAEQICNLYLLPESDIFLRKDMFDVYLCVGGDIFPDQGDFAGRKEMVRKVREGGGKVVFLGFSLFHHYCEKTQRDLREMFDAADLIAPRDEQSAEILRTLLPEKQVQVMADLAFSYPWKTCEKKKNEILGISVRRPVYADETSMNLYTSALAELIQKYLERYPHGEVRLYSLSDGVHGDREVAEAVINQAGMLQTTQIVEIQDRIRLVEYDGDVDGIVEDLSQCDLVICTRLHAMITCIAMEIPFFPVIYEVKMEHILDEVGYAGPRYYFPDYDGVDVGATVAAEAEEDSGKEENASGFGQRKNVCAGEGQNSRKSEDFLSGIEEILSEEEIGRILWPSLRQYLQKSEAVLSTLCGILSVPVWRTSVVKRDVTGPVSREKEFAAGQAALVLQKNKELETLAGQVHQKNEELETMAGQVRQKNEELEMMAAQMRQSQDTIAQCQALIAQYLNTIEELNKTCTDYFATIEQCNQRNREQSLQIEELQKKNRSFKDRLESKLRRK